MLVGALISWGWGVSPFHGSCCGHHGFHGKAGDGRMAYPGSLRRRRNHPGRLFMDTRQADRTGRRGSAINPGSLEGPPLRDHVSFPSDRSGPLDPHHRVVDAVVCSADCGAARQFRVRRRSAYHIPTLVICGLIYIVLMSFFVSSVCGYMAGLIGSSNSPLSGIGILAVLGASLSPCSACARPRPGGGHSLVAFALFVTAVIFSVACIANNNLQDLKTGQLVEATPWKQQVALIIGVIAGAAIIPPVLDVVNRAYGFAGAPGPHREHAFPVPQAGLMAALAQGVLENTVDWSLIGIGIGIGVVLDWSRRTFAARHSGAHLSPLAVGLGMYLRPKALMVVVGAVVGWYFDKRADRRRTRRG